MSFSEPADAAYPLARFEKDKANLLAEVERRVVEEHLAAAAAGRVPLEYVLNDVAYQELLRLERGAATSEERKRTGQWRDLARRLGSMSDAEKREQLRFLVRELGDDVVGRFDPRVYQFARGVLPPALATLLSPQSLSLGFRGATDLSRQIVVDGPLDVLRRLARTGTLVLVPTHSSNLDSVVLGWALNHVGLPPMTYGAGKNLFSNRFISFFLYNLGAYRVDRRLKHGLYKDVLKAYSTALLTHGYHSLFFPGGTRCRSGIVEDKLKLGLLGTVVTATQETLASGRHDRPIYVVPCTINYGIVLEAETLIDDFLAEEGKHRYIIEDDEFSRLSRLGDFGRKMLSLDGSMIIRFGAPLDPFGNAVDDDGRSRDPKNRLIDPVRYVEGAGGKIVVDAQRDTQYTRELGDALAERYGHLTVMLPTHLVARAIFDALVARTKTRDVFQLLRTAIAEEVPTVDVLQRIDRLRAYIAQNPRVGAVAPRAQHVPAKTVLDEALHVFSGYHTKAVAERHGDMLAAPHLPLLYFYRNRTARIPEEHA